MIDTTNRHIVAMLEAVASLDFRRSMPSKAADVAYQALVAEAIRLAQIVKAPDELLDRLHAAFVTCHTCGPANPPITMSEIGRHGLTFATFEHARRERIAGRDFPNVRGVTWTEQRRAFVDRAAGRAG